VQVKVPNSIVIQASVVDHTIKERVVRVRYDVPKPVDTSSMVTLLHDVVARNEWVTKPDSVTVHVENITPTDVIVLIEAFCKGAYEGPARSSILIDIEKALGKLGESKSKNE
jgi:small-conductance mechanosensitive channel